MKLLSIESSLASGAVMLSGRTTRSRVQTPVVRVSLADEVSATCLRSHKAGALEESLGSKASLVHIGNFRSDRAT